MVLYRQIKERKKNMNKNLLIKVLQELNILANSNYDGDEEDMSSALQEISHELDILIYMLEKTKE